MSPLVSLGPSWSLLVPLGPSWSLLVSPGPSWSLLVPLGLSWSLLVSPGPSWSLLVSPGLCWSLFISAGPSWSLLVPPCLCWSLLVSSGLCSTNVDQSHGLWQEQEPDLSGPTQGDHGGQRRRGEVRPHAAVHVRRVRGGLRAHQGRQLQEEGGAGRRGRADRHPGHGWSGGLRRHQRQLLPQRRGFPARLLHHGARVLHSYVRVQGADPAGEGGGGHSSAPRGQQVGPGGAAARVRRGGHGEGERVGRPVRGDVGEDESQR